MSDIPSSTAAIVLAMVDQVVAAETAAICSPSREPLVSGNALPLSDQILVPSSILSSTAKEQVNVQNNDIGKILFYKNITKYIHKILILQWYQSSLILPHLAFLMT